MQWYYFQHRAFYKVNKAIFLVTYRPNYFSNKWIDGNGSHFEFTFIKGMLDDTLTESGYKSYFSVAPLECKNFKDAVIIAVRNNIFDIGVQREEAKKTSKLSSSLFLSECLLTDLNYVALMPI